MKQFKTESKRILDLMVNSIYTNKEIFLRELISNASDAIDKLHFKALTDPSVDTHFAIRIERDEAARTLTVSDNGIGMTKEELEKNLGTIAESGTLAYKLRSEEKTELIGQFGVGFYSAFMVADKVEVVSRAYGSSEAFMWTSRGAEGYEILPAERQSVGTTVKLYLKNKDEDYDYDELLHEHHIRGLVKKYSDYVRYPIVMEVTKSRKKEGTDENPQYESYTEEETLNGMVPLWKQKKADITAEQYNEFFKSKFHEFSDPRKVFHFNLEGSVYFTAMLFIPERKPFDYYQKDYKKGLGLYSNGVLIMDKCEELLPDYLGFIKGIVDSADLSLNISREMLQHDRQLRAIATGLEKKILSELKKFMESDRDGYDKFFEEFGLSLKFGAYNDFGARKEEVKDLLLFRSSTLDTLVTFSEYVSRMKPDQKYIYYACGDSVEKISRLPQTELLREKGYEILYMPDNVDEFVLRALSSYDGKEFRSAGAKDLGLETDEEKKEMQSRAEENKEMFDFMKEALGGAVKEVRLSSRMKNNAACLTADGEISLEMEKVFRAMKNSSPMPVTAEKALELNPDHKLFARLKSLFASDKDKLAEYTRVLYAMTLIGEGMELDDPAALISSVTDIMSED